MSNEPMLQVEGEPIDDYSILNQAIPRIIKSRKGEDLLGIEIFDGPYKGIIFGFTTFNVMKNTTPDDNGFVPVKFEYIIYEKPKDLHINEEQFDAYTREFLMAWLVYLQSSPSVFNFAKQPGIGGRH